MRIEEIDKNFLVKTNIDNTDTVFINADCAPFEICGVFKEGGRYRRMPEKIAKSVSDGVYSLHANTAGGRVRFITDSDFIAIKTSMDEIGKMPHFAFTGSIGFDMYVNNEYHSSFIPPFYIEDGYESKKELGEKRMREICINFPLYSNVKELYIGLSRGSVVEKPSPYVNEKPVVYYGSSITQGGCASRPGMSYQSIVSREVNCDYVNLGFSGNAHAQDTVIEYISNLEMSVFVMDYDHNAPTTEHLEKTHEKFFMSVRNNNPNLPIVLLQRPQYKISGNDIIRGEIVNKTFQNAIKRGDNNVYLITSDQLTAICKDEGTVDGVHPTDFGFASMAIPVSAVLSKIFDK